MASNGSGYAYLSVAPTASIQGVNPTLLSALNRIGEQTGQTIQIFSGYRSPSYSAKVGGYSNDPHTRGEAVDANINGKPIGDVIPLATLSKYGLQGGNQPGFYNGQTDPEHVQIPGSGVDKGMESPALGGSAPTGTTFAEARNTEPAATATGGSGPSLTSGQATFIQRLSQQTGLNKALVAGWVYNEENGSAAQSYQNSGDNDWLNIGRTDSGNYGAANNVWKDPVSAADATAAWMEGKYSLPGFGTASSGIQNFVKGAQSGTQSLSAQIAGLQNSGWASGGYPSLPSIVSSFSGQPIQGSAPSASGSTATGQPSTTGAPTQAMLMSAQVPAQSATGQTLTPAQPQQVATRVSVLGQSLSQELTGAAQSLLTGGTPDLKSLFSIAAGFQKARAAVPKTPSPLGGTPLALKSGGLT